MRRRFNQIPSAAIDDRLSGDDNDTRLWVTKPEVTSQSLQVLKVMSKKIRCLLTENPVTSMTNRCKSGHYIIDGV